MDIELFNEMLGINEAIKHLEQAKEKVDYAYMEMSLGRLDVPYQSYKDEVNAAYYGLIPQEERDKLTAEMRERLKAAITQRINELKAKFKAL